MPAFSKYSRKKGGGSFKCNFFAVTLTNFNSLIKTQLRTIAAMNKKFQFVDLHILHNSQTHRSTLDIQQMNFNLLIKMQCASLRLAFV